MRPNIERQVAVRQRDHFSRGVASYSTAFLLLVRFQVDGQIAVLGEAFAADVAFIWPLTRVNPHVDLQIVGVRETLAAHFAQERFVASVRVHVQLEGDTLSERLPANLTLERFLSSMGSQMDLQLMPTYKVELTETAAKVVAILTQSSAQRNLFQADVTKAVPFSIQHAHVNILLADFALVLLPIG